MNGGLNANKKVFVFCLNGYLVVNVLPNAGFGVFDAIGGHSRRHTSYLAIGFNEKFVTKCFIIKD